jgi:NAD(P)-dependent dehydrogenase (short-subunit alcohol dehydrogenase family)
MNIDLSTRHAVVSGSSAGIGFAIARGLAEAGASVTLNGRDPARLDAAVDRLRRMLPAASAASVAGVAADLGTAEGAATLFGQVADADILINNLGMFESNDFFATADDDWLRFFRVNVLGAVRLSRHYVPGMVRRGWGRVLFLSSESAVQPTPDMVPYGMSKAALLAVSRGLAGAVAASGVTVNAVLPGPTRSEGVAGLLAAAPENAGLSNAEREAEFIRLHRPGSLIRRLASPEEVASFVVYLASTHASATTGAALRVDGGVWPSIL